MNFVGLEKESAEELSREIDQGGRFVVYPYCISLGVLTFKRTSSVHFIRKGQSRTRHSLVFVLISCWLGWWGIPWGPIWTIQSIKTNLSGGQDVTQEVLESIRTQATGQFQSESLSFLSRPRPVWETLLIGFGLIFGALLIGALVVLVYVWYINRK